jgi:hypothetical protein
MKFTNAKCVILNVTDSNTNLKMLFYFLVLEFGTSGITEDCGQLMEQNRCPLILRTNFPPEPMIPIFFTPIFSTIFKSLLADGILKFRQQRFHKKLARNFRDFREFYTLLLVGGHRPHFTSKCCSMDNSWANVSTTS